MKRNLGTIPNVDALTISEKTLDAAFPDTQFQIYGFLKPFHLYQKQLEGNTIVYVYKDIKIKFLSPEARVMFFFFKEKIPNHIYNTYAEIRIISSLSLITHRDREFQYASIKP